MSQIEQLAKAYAKLERLYRLQIAAFTVVTALAGLINMAGSLTEGRLALPNAIRWGAMTILALTGYLSAMHLYRVWKKQNAEIVDLYRQLTGAVEMMDGWRPLFAAIEHAHSQGYAAVIAPGDLPEDEPPPGKLN